MADSASPVTDTSNIQNSGAGYTGNFNVNQAAGDQQQQTNVRAIAIGTNATATTSVTQKITTAASRAVNASSTIGGNSFSNGNGALGVNQSAGPTTRWPMPCGSASVPIRKALTTAPCHNRTWRCYQTQEQLALNKAAARSLPATRPSPAAVE
ncbi:hypothetical protein PBOI14_40040 [Pseudomonas sp. Boi14]|nr:hypothetical protein PBOI14_40040 [Pseudomonas sp. Boi14]